MNDLIPQSTLQKLDATSRIEQSASPKPTTNLADLEHHVMADLMNNPRFNVVNAYFQDAHTANRNHTHLISLTPFRSGRANVSYIIKPNDFKPDEMKPNDNTFNVYHADSVKHYGLSGSNTENSVIEPYVVATTSPFVSVWLDSHLQQVLIELEHRFVELSPNSVVIRFSNIALATQQNNKTQQSYYFDERFGCWKKSN